MWHTVCDMERTTLAELVETRLGAPLIPWLRQTRSELGSWDATATELHARTGVLVSRETVRRWADQARNDKAAA